MYFVIVIATEINIFILITFFFFWNLFNMFLISCIWWFNIWSVSRYNFVLLFLLIIATVTIESNFKFFWNCEFTFSGTLKNVSWLDLKCFLQSCDQDCKVGRTWACFLPCAQQHYNCLQSNHPWEWSEDFQERFSTTKDIRRNLKNVDRGVSELA